jgi:hypothetical protein
MAGSAMATCSNPTPFAAWSSWDAVHSKNAGQSFGGTTVAADGLHTTSCAMSSYFTLFNQSLGEQAIVYDNSPQKEQTYRFRFYIDPTNVKSTLSSLNSVGIFGGKSATTHGTTNLNNQVVYMFINGDGTGNVFLRTIAACTTGDAFQGNKCQSNAGDVQLPFTSGSVFTGGVRIEGQVIIGAAGTGKVNVWVGSNVGTPDRVINVDNAAWGTAGSDGIKQAALGLQVATGTFQQANHDSTHNVLFDEFDSRRQTAIGP